MKGLPRSTRRASQAIASVVKRVVPLRNFPIVVAGATGIGFGSGVVMDLPEGNILLLGLVANLTFSKSAGATGVQDTWDGDFGIGTTPASDATITGGDVDLIASTATGAATAGVSPVKRATQATQSIIDNTANDLEINLNLLIDDANISADAQTIYVNGDLVVAYIVMSDD